ncbi:IclR family transcriptional regulator [Paenirhodobacter sp.]|uniref:IclR family transcriptional regulator n=1 Tax=Paenirhodobacter sp. TaxID=1965326 RepID=UPI003B40F916
MTEPEGQAPQMRAVERIAAILGSFSATRPVLTLSEVTREAGLDKNTVRRLLLALCGPGLIVRVGEGYGLGPAVLRMQPAVAAPRALREASASWLHELTQALGMTSFAWLPDPMGAVCVERARAQRGLFAAAHWSSPGTVLPLNVAAGPRVILAHLSVEAQAEWLAREQPRVTQQSETDPVALRRVAEQIRAEGHAFVADDLVVGLAGLGVPVFDRQGAFAGAISVTAPTHVLRDDTQRPLAVLRRVAAEVGVRLG